jgi:hypothetical protein
MPKLIALPLLVLLVGCAQTRTFEVSVQNNTPDPITIGLVKEGDPFQRDWESPEEAAIAQRQPSARMWAAIPPGKTAGTGPIKGRFDSKARAILRVYQGELNLSGILAVSRGSPGRMDIPLHPGMNRFIVSKQEDQLQAIRVDGGSPVPVDER